MSQPDLHSVETRNAERGYTVIELLIVVALIAVIMAIAVPGLGDTKKAAHEAAAISYLRTWPAAQELYHLKHGNYADADNQLFAEGLIGVGQPDQLGYVFAIDNPPGSQHVWWGSARPTRPGTTGDRYFFIDTMGVIRYSLGGPANENSSAIGSTTP
jgi:prepilin-type N-terminal cleavage/methylation domain-containing protein